MTSSLIKNINRTEKTKKPWGYELLLASNKKYAMKILCINEGECLSLQYHKFKHETMFLSSGEAILIYQEPKGINPIKKNIHSGTIIDIPPKTKHRLIAKEMCIVVECSTPHLDDIIRVEDKYNR